MKPIFQKLILALSLNTAAMSVQAVTYICKVDGGIVFTEKKIGNQCEESHADGAAQISPEEATQAFPQKANLKEAPGAAAPDVSDIKILPQVTSGSVTNSAEAANPRMNVKLRNGNDVATGRKSSAGDLKSAQARAAELNRKAKIIPAPTVAVPVAKPKPQLTRKQILQNEIRNEQAALARAKVQLNVARKKGDQVKISRLSQTVRDREANIRAIQGEMKR
ncbi:hypothetical protein [Neisseria iguanae]|uniref:DUF4124 domain-containing protein n=1 Tax=Neisseria iguanae TaxID=90242 RepID=A0A2P7TWW8_9NEIS|nr:hypothetical protein [Neisseria iguanae]PSJ79194.1 hypothetical protein C7N83_13750 [Neisseria iguanae]